MVYRDQSRLRRRDVQCAIVLGMAGLFIVVAWRSVQPVNMLWDEQQDYPIATALLKHPLWGTGDEGSQARLPMYAVAMVFALTGESLATARVVSIVVGALTIVMTWVAGGRWFGGTTGLLAAGLLAISPYFLGFSRTALTEGDAFCPLTVLVTLLAFDTYLRRHDARGVLLLSAALGLAVAAKFLAVVLVPALILCALLQPPGEPHDENERTGPVYRAGLAWIAAAALLEALAIAAAQTQQVALSIALWAAGACVMLVAGHWLLRQRPVRWSVLMAWLAILLLAMTLCVAAFPEHVIQPAMVGELLSRLSHWDHSYPSAFLGDNARLYSGILLLKLGVPLGLLSVAALLWACSQGAALRRIVMVVGIYLGWLLLLPLRQTFYLMSIYPLVILLLATLLVQTMAALRRSPLLQGCWLAIVIAASLWLVWGTMHVYPTFGWYGYETIGDRWLGEESRGYRNIIQVTNDGTEDALWWLVDHVPAEARVVNYLSDYHVIRAFTERHPIHFTLIQGGGEQEELRILSLGDLDYLVVGPEYLIHGQTPLIGDAEAGVDVVHTVWRGRGVYRMPVVQIYQIRRHS